MTTQRSVWSKSSASQRVSNILSEGSASPSLPFRALLSRPSDPVAWSDTSGDDPILQSVRDLPACGRQTQLNSARLDYFNRHHLESIDPSLILSVHTLRITLFNMHDLVFVPQPQNQQHEMYTIDRDQAQRLACVLNATRPKIRRQNTFPCSVRSPQSTQPVHLQPFISPTDTGLYLPSSAIKQLGLHYTGVNELTPQGPARIFSGVSLRFSNDLLGGHSSYTFIEVYELPQNQRVASKSQPSLNVKQDGVLGLRHLSNHVILALQGDVTVLGRQGLHPDSWLGNAFPLLSPYGANSDSRSSLPDNMQEFIHTLNPPEDDAVGQNDVPQLSGSGSIAIHSIVGRLPFVERNTVIETKTFSPLNRSSAIRVPSPTLASIEESCRACNKLTSNVGVCGMCVRERRPVRAVYCSQTCQESDWVSVHRLEHARRLFIREHENASEQESLEKVCAVATAAGWTVMQGTFQ